MKQANLFFVLVAFATISIFSSCDSTGGYQRPDLSSVASGLHNAGTDTMITSDHCNIDYVPVIGKNCAGKTVVRKKSVMSQVFTSTSIRQEGHSLTSDDLVNLIKSIGYRIVPDRGHGYSDAIKNPVKSENSFLENFEDILKILLLVFLIVAVCIILWSLLRKIYRIFHPHPQTQAIVGNPAQPVNNWTSETIQPLCNDLQNIVKDAVGKGNEVKLNANSTATSTTVDLHITRKDPTPDLKKEG